MAVSKGFKLEIQSRGPVHECQAPRGHHDGRFELGTVAMAIEILDAMHNRCEDTALPRPDVVRPVGGNELCWMKVEVTANLFVL